MERRLNKCSNTNSQNGVHINEFAEEFNKIGGVDIIDDLIIHPNKSIKEASCQIISRFYRNIEDNDFTSSQFDDASQNDWYGWVDFVIPSTCKESNGIKF